MAYLELLDITEASLDSSNEGVTWIRLNKTNKRRELTAAVMCIDLLGNAEVLVLR